jgi:hypothetical protein
MSNQPMPPPPKRDNKYLILTVGIIVILAIALVAVIIATQPESSTQPNTTSQNQFTLANFNSTVGDDPAIQAYVDLEVNNYGINGNTVYCSGTVTLRTTEYTLSGYALCLLVTSTSSITPYALEAELIGYGGVLLLPTIGHTVINSTSVSVPTLGNGTNVYNFSLEVPCSPTS